MEHLATRSAGGDSKTASGRGDLARATVRRPRSRPPVAMRIIAALFGASALLFNAALMLSDRAPNLTRRILGGFQRRLSERIDSDSRVRLAADGRLPESDTLVHIGVWAVAVILIGLALWSWRGLAISAITIFVMSIAVELGQGQFSETRSVEKDDLLANAIGIAAGIAVTAFAYVAWSAAATAVGNTRSRAHR